MPLGASCVGKKRCTLRFKFLHESMARCVHASCCKLHPQVHVLCMAVIDAIICVCVCQHVSRPVQSSQCSVSLEQSLGAAAGCRAEDPSGSCCYEVVHFMHFTDRAAATIPMIEFRLYRQTRNRNPPPKSPIPTPTFKSPELPSPPFALIFAAPVHAAADDRTPSAGCLSNEHGHSFRVLAMGLRIRGLVKMRKLLQPLLVLNLEAFF